MVTSENTESSEGESELERKYKNSLLLFVGEGNFSFSAAVSTSPQFTLLNCHLIATDLAPELKNQLAENREKGLDKTADAKVPGERMSSTLQQIEENVSILEVRNHRVLFDVDASNLLDHQELLSFINSIQGLSKIYVIFNFPHVKSKKMKIGLNRDLLRHFFISCDKLFHQLGGDNDEGARQVEIIPIVSLCAGQSGIQEVESVSREWSDSWQVNDMAAHGSFVCTSVNKFDQWDLYKLSCPSGDIDIAESTFTSDYKSSYYRLQNSVSFITNEGLTFTYEHRPHIDACKVNRLNEILHIFGSSKIQQKVSSLLTIFGPILEEKIISRAENPEDVNIIDGLPYFHRISFRQKDINITINHVLRYLSISDSTDRVQVLENEKDPAEDKLLFLKVPPLPTSADNLEKAILVGKASKDNAHSLYVNVLLELKYLRGYRNILLDSKSLYPHTHEFHISFWVSNKFTMDLFMEVLLDVYGLMLKSLQFVEEYMDKLGRKSICWCVKVQSLELALSRLTAHEIYLKLRQELSNRLDVIVR